MGRRLWVGLTLVLSAAVVQAGAPPDRGGAQQGGRDRGGRRAPGMRGGPFGAMMGRFRAPLAGRVRETDVFDVARRSSELSEESAAAVGKLDGQHATEEREATAELKLRLNKKYAALIAELLPEKQKTVYQQVVEAMLKRDEAVAAARKAMDQAVQACRARVVELVGEERARAVLGPAPGEPMPRPGGPPPRGGAAPAPGARNRPEF